MILTGKGSNLVVDTRDENFTVRSDQSAHDLEKISHRLVNGATEHTRMQISARTLNGKMEVRHSTETICQTRLGSSEPVVVRDTDSIDISKVLLSFEQNKIIKTLRARLLHTLKAHLQVNREVQAQVLVSLNDIEPSKNRALVITASATEKTALIILNQLEGIGIPAVLEQSLRFPE